MKASELIDAFFKKMRFDEDHHLGMGDIRLTIGQQEALVDAVKEIKSGGVEASTEGQSYTDQEIRHMLCEGCKLGLQDVHFPSMEEEFCHTVNGYRVSCKASRWREVRARQSVKEDDSVTAPDMAHARKEQRDE